MTLVSRTIKGRLATANTVTTGYKCTFLCEGGTETAADESVMCTVVKGYKATVHNCKGYNAVGVEPDGNAYLVNKFPAHNGACAALALIPEVKGPVVSILLPPVISKVTVVRFDATYHYVEGFRATSCSVYRVGTCMAVITYGSDR